MTADKQKTFDYLKHGFTQEDEMAGIEEIY